MILKNLIRNKHIRHEFMKMGKWIPDKIMLRLQYYISMGKIPNLKIPMRFSEKIQCYKMYYRNELMLLCANKYTVRKYIKDCNIPNLYLPVLYADARDASNLPIDSLPKQFVIKTSDGGNGDNVRIVKDKYEWDYSKDIPIINSWRNKQYEIISREWAYSGNIESIIIVEELLEDDNNSDKIPIDYKFFCFNGVVKCFKIDFSRFSNHRANYYSKNMELLSVEESSFPCDSSFKIPNDANIPLMIEIAEELAKPFPFVRVDLYSIKGKIYFGELTFYPMSGFGKFNPDDFDVTLGSYFTIY